MERRAEKEVGESSPNAERAAPGDEPGTAHLDLIVGPVGAGKSTLALQLSQRRRAIHMNLDEWMAELFRPDRPEYDVLAWYRERTDRCIAQIWRLTSRLLDADVSAVLEIGLLRRAEREDFYRRVEATHHALTIHVVDAPRALRRERVRQRNERQGATFSMVVPAEIFELASDLWEPLDEHECRGRNVRFVHGA